MIEILTMVGYLNLSLENIFWMVLIVFIASSLLIKFCKSESETDTKHDDSLYDSGIWEDRKPYKQNIKLNDESKKEIGVENEKRIKDANDIRMLATKERLRLEPKWNKEAEDLYNLLIINIEDIIKKDPTDTSITIYSPSNYQEQFAKGIHHRLCEQYINSDNKVKRKFKELVIENGFGYYERYEHYFFITITWEKSKDEQ